MATRSKALEEVVMDDFVAKAMKNIDMDALITRLIPKLEKELEERLLDIFRDSGTVVDAIYDAMSSKVVQQHFKQKFEKILTSI